jgi:hypothetical protein
MLTDADATPAAQHANDTYFARYRRSGRRRWWAGALARWRYRRLM